MMITGTYSWDSVDACPWFPICILTNDYYWLLFATSWPIWLWSVYSYLLGSEVYEIYGVQSGIFVPSGFKHNCFLAESAAPFTSKSIEDYFFHSGCSWKQLSGHSSLTTPWPSKPSTSVQNYVQTSASHFFFSSSAYYSASSIALFAPRAASYIPPITSLAKSPKSNLAFYYVEMKLWLTSYGIYGWNTFYYCMIALLNLLDWMFGRSCG